MRYRKKPIVVEAMRLPDELDIDGRLKFEDWLTDSGRACRYVGDGLDVPTLEGVMRASKGDYIIKGVKGEIYPCKPDIFEATYEEVENDQ